MKKELKNDKSKLYDFDYETKKQKKDKKKKADEKSASKNKGNINIAGEEIVQASKRKKYDDEIIIGVTRYPEQRKNENKKTENKSTSYNKEKNIKRRKNKKYTEQYSVDKSNNSKVNIKLDKKKTRNQKILKIFALLVLISSASAFALMSPIFNVQEIEILGNKQITKDELESLSQIEPNYNIFRVQNKKVIDEIKQNAYVNDVKIYKKLPSTIQIKIVEREPSYMLEYGNGYVYISNQGYMLEISTIKKELPVLLGTSTSKDEYKTGSRLNEEDLIKLGTVIKIMNSAQTNNIANIITKIDISNSNNYKLYFETENKVAYLGDCSNLETRMLFLVGILEKEKEYAGEIFIDMNLNSDNAYFRENV